MERVPLETLSTIMLHVRVLAGPAALASCALCCKQWRDVVLPLLAKDIVLSDSRVEGFILNFSRLHACGVLVRSLTLTFKPVSPSPDLYYLTALPPPVGTLDAGPLMPSSRLAAGGGKSMLELLLRPHGMAAAISGMPKLATFSLTVAPGRIAGDFWLPRPAIATIVASLPAACVDVEIDTRGRDFALVPGAQPHLCDVLRAALPRLRHLRLRLSVMCAALFASRDAAAPNAGKDDDEDADGKNSNADMADAHAVAVDPQAAPTGAVMAPALKSLYISCVTHSTGGPPRLCGTLDVGPRMSTDHSAPWALRDALENALQTLLEAGCFPAVEQLKLVDMERIFSLARCFYDGMYRHDMLRNETMVLNFVNVHGPAVDSRGYEYRQRYLDFYQPEIEAIIEGESWAQTLCGVRVPVAVAESGIGKRWAGRVAPKLIHEWDLRYLRSASLKLSPYGG